jgi:uncharacterized protein
MATVNRNLRTITLEEHYATSAFMEGPGRDLKELARAAQAHPLVMGRFANLVDQLTDIGEKRIANMDEAGIDMQVLSLTSPGVEQLEPEDAVKLARESNDALAKAAEKNPTRLAGFAAVPTPAPEKAADELERTVKNYGFKGGLINGHSRGRYLDDKFFHPILKRAEELHVPIYLHPTRPPEPVVQAYYTGNFPPEVTTAVSIAGWGWHIETAVHMIRVILGGVFDEHPKLQFVLGHLGESLPFMLRRLDIALPQQLTKLKRPPSSYLRENVHYTFSGFNFMPTFLDLLMEVGVDRIMFSADYPYASMAQARTFLEQVPLSPADREKVAHGNAEKLMKF